MTMIGAGGVERPLCAGGHRFLQPDEQILLIRIGQGEQRTGDRNEDDEEER